MAAVKPQATAFCEVDVSRPEWGQHGLCPVFINMLLCTLSPLLDSHILIHVIEWGGKTLYVHTAFGLEVTKAE